MIRTYDTVNPSAIVFTVMSLACSLPVGAATISLGGGCTLVVSLPGPTRTADVDTSISGTACLRHRHLRQDQRPLHTCTANLQGTIGATFNETVKTGGWQDLILNGTGTLANQSAGCGGALTGALTLNTIDLNVKPASGSINFV